MIGYGMKKLISRVVRIDVIPCHFAKYRTHRSLPSFLFLFLPLFLCLFLSFLNSQYRQASPNTHFVGRRVSQCRQSGDVRGYVRDNFLTFDRVRPLTNWSTEIDGDGDLSPPFVFRALLSYCHSRLYRLRGITACRTATGNFLSLSHCLPTRFSTRCWSNSAVIRSRYRS